MVVNPQLDMPGQPLARLGRSKTARGTDDDCTLGHPRIHDAVHVLCPFVLDCRDYFVGLEKGNQGGIQVGKEK